MAVHALTGCDTVPKMYGTGKKKSLNIMKKKTSHCPGEDASYADFMFHEGSHVFVVADYFGMIEVSSSSNSFDKNIQRFLLFHSKLKALCNVTGRFS